MRETHLKDDGDILPASIPPGPDNPLGEYALRLGIPGGAYLIHGTNKPVGVGMQITHGCIRLYPEDIEYLFGEVPVGMAVRIVNQRIKTGWVDGALYLEVHHPLDGADPKDTRGSDGAHPQSSWPRPRSAGSSSIGIPRSAYSRGERHTDAHFDRPLDRAGRRPRFEPGSRRSKKNAAACTAAFTRT